MPKAGCWQVNARGARAARRRLSDGGFGFVKFFGAARVLFLIVRRGREMLVELGEAGGRAGFGIPLFAFRIPHSLRSLL